MRLRDVGLYPRQSWRGVSLLSLLVRVVDVMLLLLLVVLRGVVVGDALGGVDAAGGEAHGEGVFR